MTELRILVTRRQFSTVAILNLTGGDSLNQCPGCLPQRQNRHAPAHAPALMILTVRTDSTVTVQVLSILHRFWYNSLTAAIGLQVLLRSSFGCPLYLSLVVRRNTQFTYCTHNSGAGSAAQGNVHVPAHAPAPVILTVLTDPTVRYCGIGVTRTALLPATGLSSVAVQF